MNTLKMWILAIWAFFVPNFLQKHVTAQSAVQSYRVVSDSSGRGQTTVTEVQVKNDKFYIQTEGYIAVDNTLYYQDSNGSWKSKILDPDTTEKFNRFRPSWVAQNLQDNLKKSTFKPLGKEKCGDLTCFKYQEIDPKDPTATRIFWFDDKDYFLRKDIFTFGEFKSENTYTYDNINIQIPS